MIPNVEIVKAGKVLTLTIDDLLKTYTMIQTNNWTKNIQT